jgi:uncharacterized membrane protein HdeD (DUF308 family)
MVAVAAKPHESTSQTVFGDHLPRHNWAWFLIRGVIALLLGLVALFAPGVTVFAFALVFAAFSFADGVTQLVTGIRGATHKSQRYGSLIFSGIVGVAIGVLFVIWPLLSTFVYTMMLVVLVGFWALVTGVLEIAAAVRLRRAIAGEWLLGLSGALSVLFGLVVLALVLVEPGLTMLSLGWLIAFYAFASGVALIILAFRLRRKANA